MEDFKSQPLRDWAHAQGFTAVHPEVRTNKAGYPYLSFIKPDGKGGNTCENVYFAKGSADTALGLGTISKEERGNLLVCETTNASGEARIKLAFKGENSYEAI